MYSIGNTNNTMDEKMSNNKYYIVHFKVEIISHCRIYQNLDKCV